MPLCILHLEKNISELGIWFRSYDHFSDIICKTPSSDQNVFSLFKKIFFFNLCLFSERDFSFEVEILLQCH